MTPSKLIELGWSQFAAVCAALVGILAVLWVISAWDWQELYYREFVLPRLQTKYGFRLGPLRAVRGSSTYFEGFGIASVVRNGEFFRMGVRPGDAPFEYHGGGFSAMYSALDAAERGGFAAFDVVNAYDASAGMDGFRTIAVNPRVREVPSALPYLQQRRSPTNQLTLMFVGTPVDDTDRELWVWDPASGSRSRLSKFRRFVSPTWSADGRWLAVTDEDPGQTSRCVVIDLLNRRKRDLTDAVMQLPRSIRPCSSERLDCKVFGWVLDTPSRLAVVFTDLGANPGEKWIYDFYFDTPTGALVAAQSR